ncbi:MAG: type III secretion system chaperone [Victivallales bacterium]|nr:type III secretion system chaperone [Victivallales bacterium]
MNTSFEDVASLAESRYRDAFVRGAGNSFSLLEDGRQIDFFQVPGELATSVVRARVLSIANMLRAADFAKACIAGNFFWSGTRGATLSISEDDVLYLTERRPLDELADADGFDACLENIMQAITDWQERSALYE